MANKANNNLIDSVFRLFYKNCNAADFPLYHMASYVLYKRANVAYVKVL